MRYIKAHNNIPEIYSTSRDFQLFENLYTIIFNGIKYNVDSILDITNTSCIRNDLLELLKYKLGFFTTKHFNNEELRETLIAFPYLVKNKGSKESIEGAVHLFCKIKGIKQNPKIRYSKWEEEKITEQYVVRIQFELVYADTTLLEEIFKFILPTGWFYVIEFLKDLSDETGDGAIYYKSYNLGVIAEQRNNDGDDILKNATIRNSGEYNDDESKLEKDILQTSHLGYIQGNDTEETIIIKQNFTEDFVEEEE